MPVNVYGQTASKKFQSAWLTVTNDVLLRYANDNNLLVSENTDVSLADDYMQSKVWADKDIVKINHEKQKNWRFIISPSNEVLYASVSWGYWAGPNS